MLMKRCYRVDPKQIEEIMEVIKEFFPENTSIAISDTNEYLYYQPSKKVDDWYEQHGGKEFVQKKFFVEVKNEEIISTIKKVDG